jgi:DNA helicase-2/ATP-dependent DNA helicase PcrA
VQVEKYLIAHNPIQAAKPKLNVFFKPKQQTAFLVTSIIRQLAEGKKPKEIAVLARTIKGASVCRYLPAALRENDIPYKVVGGFDVMNSIHIKNMLSVFYLALGNTDLANWITALLIFPDIGEVRSKQIAKCVPDWDKAKIPKASANSIKEFRCLISKIAESTSDAHDCFLKFYRWYADLIDEHYTVDHRHGYTHRQRGEIDDLFNYIEGTFEQHTDLAEAVDILVMDIDDEDINEDAVTISSIHRAKGLEWSVVYIPDCVATMYPHKMCTKLEDKQEELRIFHVAVTRARDELYLTADLTPIRESRPYLSPFLDLRYVTAPNPRIIEWYTLDAKSFWRNAKLRDEAEKENESGGA